MRKSLIAAAVIAAGVFAWYKFGTPSSAVQLEAREYVPADTAVFSAQLEPVDLPSYLSSIGMGPQYYNAEALARLDEQLQAAQDSSAKFILALSKQYLSSLATPADISTKTGIKAQMRSLLYMVGIAPVLKVELSDEKAFWAMFDAIEQQSGLTHTTQQSGALQYRQYVLTHEELVVDFLVSVKDGWATLTLMSDKLDPSHLAIALGAQKPEQNLSGNAYLTQISKKYALDAGSVGYVSAVELAKVLTSKDANRLAKDVESLFGTELDSVLATWREPACQADVAGIAASWPGLFASNRFETVGSATKVHSKMLIPTENTKTLSALQQLQGFIPAGLGEVKELPAMLAIGLGLDVGQLSSAAGKIWENLTTTTYQCAPLAQWQASLKQNNPMPMLMMAGMAAGVQGVSLHVNHLEFDAAQQVPKTADALFVLSAVHVKQLFDGVKALQPAMAAIELPAAGEILPLADKIPELAMFGVKPNLMASEHHLMIFSGDRALQQAKALSSQPLNKAGLLAFGMDYQQFFSVLKSTMENSGEEVPAEILQLMQTNMQLGMQMSIAPQGILLQSTMQMSQ